MANISTNDPKGSQAQNALVWQGKRAAGKSTFLAYASFVDAQEYVIGGVTYSIQKTAVGGAGTVVDCRTDTTLAQVLTRFAAAINGTAANACTAVSSATQLLWTRKAVGANGNVIPSGSMLDTTGVQSITTEGRDALTADSQFLSLGQKLDYDTLRVFGGTYDQWDTHFDHFVDRNPPTWGTNMGLVAGSVQSTVAVPNTKYMQSYNGFTTSSVPTAHTWRVSARVRFLSSGNAYVGLLNNYSCGFGQITLNGRSASRFYVFVSGRRWNYGGLGDGDTVDIAPRDSLWHIFEVASLGDGTMVWQFDNQGWSAPIALAGDGTFPLLTTLENHQCTSGFEIDWLYRALKIA